MNTTTVPVPETRPLKIAYLQQGLNFGGAQSSLLLLQRVMKSYGIISDLFVSAYSATDLYRAFSQFNRRIFRIRLWPMYNTQGLKTPLHMFFLKRIMPVDNFLRLLADGGYDLLHINTTGFSHILKDIHLRCPLPVVVHAREMIPQWGRGTVQRYMIRQISTYADAIIAISDNEASYFQGHRGLHIQPNPFDFDSVKPPGSSFRSAHGISESAVLVGMTGQFHPLKGHLDFLRAARRVLAEISGNRSLVFVVLGTRFKRDPLWKRPLKYAMGRSDYVAVVSNYLRAHDMVMHFRLIPFSQDVLSFMSEVDIMVRPAITGDPWGRDIIEAMALGKPVVATGDSEFYVRHGRTGFLVPPGNPDILASRILQLVNDGELRAKMGREGAQRIRNMCDLSVYGEQIMTIYRSLVLSNSREPPTTEAIEQNRIK